MKVKTSKKTILGVIGGSGPEAGINVMEKMLLIHKEGMGEAYRSDKDAASIILMQDPGMGGPHGTWDLEDANSEPYIELWENIKCLVRKLNAIDVEFFCITCNTLHFLEPKIREWMVGENMTTNFVSIVESTKTAIVRHYSKNNRLTNPEISNSFIRENVLSVGKRARNRVAILGSYLTTDIMGFSPYKGLFDGDDNDLECVLIEEEKRKHIQFLISETKRRGATSDLQKQFFNLVNEEFVVGSSVKTDYIVLACTELPLLLSEEGREKLETCGIVTIDPNFVLAEEMLRYGGYLVETK